MSLRFVTVTSPDPAAAYLADLMRRKLVLGQRVVWFVTGGSAVAVAVAVAVALQLESAPLEKLTVTLTDERYGPVGHADSNWKQLMDTGFALPGAKLVPVLTGASKSETVSQWGEEVNRVLEMSDTRIGLFGIGPDGHTSGILPGSPAVEASGTAFAYDGGAYQRITTTNAAISRLDEAVAYVVGRAKWPVLDQLEHDVSLALQPAQILKRLPKLTIFTDHPEAKNHE
ncbi:MAG TPA: 6-phosphogluconolactonase [Candidatus Saccharimonadia bacterium]|nr:6-phosphogluconolactonase [Candidatus Saccharimonadia bacterium]